MTPLAQQLTRIEAEQTRLSDVVTTHAKEDNDRFEKHRSDREDGDRRLHERLEQMFAAFRKDVRDELGAWDKKVNDLLGTYTDKVTALERERAEAHIEREKALAFQAGIASAKTPSQTKLAFLQGIAGAAAAALFGVVATVIALAANAYIHGQTVPGSDSTRTTTIHESTHR